MLTKDIDFASKNHKNISEKIESVTFNSIRKVLPGKAIKDACNASGYRYRQRIITPIVTVMHMILAAIVRLLLAKGAKVDERDDMYEFTALHYAARFGRKNVAELLSANGADITAKDKWEYQPIHWAAYHDRPDIIELLISKGADVNAKTSLGETPLQLAIPRRNTGAIEVLLKYGAEE